MTLMKSKQNKIKDQKDQVTESHFSVKVRRRTSERGLHSKIQFIMKIHKINVEIDFILETIILRILV